MFLKIFYRVVALFYAFFYKAIYFNSFYFKFFRFSLNGTLLIINGKLIVGDGFSARLGTILNVNGGILRIEENVFLNNYCTINCRDNIYIGSGTIIGEGVRLYDHDHAISESHIVSRNRFVTAPIKIGNNVWIGANAVILKGVEIGDNAVISAGAIITKSVPSNVTVIQKKVTDMIRR